MIAQDQAEALRREYRPQFSSDDAFQASWDRFWEKFRRAANTSSARRWLDEDLEADRAQAAGSVRAPLLPVRQNTDELEERIEYPSGHDYEHPERCPRCLKRQREGRPGFSFEVLPTRRIADPIRLLAGRIDGRSADAR